MYMYMYRVCIWMKIYMYMYVVFCVLVISKLWIIFYYMYNLRDIHYNCNDTRLINLVVYFSQVPLYHPMYQLMTVLLSTLLVHVWMRMSYTGRSGWQASWTQLVSNIDGYIHVHCSTGTFEWKYITVLHMYSTCIQTFFTGLFLTLW